PVAAVLPDFVEGDPRKTGITARDLLLHRSGLPAWRPLHEEGTDPAALRRVVLATPLASAPGSATGYSDLGFMVLGWVVEAVAGVPLNDFLEGRVFAPLGMADTGFRPPAAARDRIAPTERGTPTRPYLVHGEVHDENAFLLGGVAGHAGL